MIKKLSKGLRKFIRLEKNRIRREISDFKTQETLINDLYQKYLKPVKEDKSSFSPSSH